MQDRQHPRLAQCSPPTDLMHPSQGQNGVERGSDPNGSSGPNPGQQLEQPGEERQRNQHRVRSHAHHHVADASELALRVHLCPRVRGLDLLLHRLGQPRAQTVGHADADFVLFGGNRRFFLSLGHDFRADRRGTTAESAFTWNPLEASPGSP